MAYKHLISTVITIVRIIIIKVSQPLADRTSSFMGDSKQSWYCELTRYFNCQGSHARCRQPKGVEEEEEGEEEEGRGT